MKKYLALSLSDVVFIMLINVKMPTILGILTLMSRINLCSAEFSMKKRFITLGPCHKRLNANNPWYFNIYFQDQYKLRFFKVINVFLAFSIV